MESIVKVPSVAGDMDFLAFSFNGKHSWDDFGIIRTSDGDRYNENLVPAMQDKTAEVPGGDGMYYFGTTHKQRDFNINIAFDNMSEVKYREMRQWLNGKETGDLWFSEAPYKVYTVKPTGTPSLKTLCFDRYNETTGCNERVYKGEGTIQFTAYWPYAHTPDWIAPAGELFTEEKEEVISASMIIDYLGNGMVFRGNKEYTIVFNKLGGEASGLTLMIYPCDVVNSGHNLTSAAWNVSTSNSNVIRINHSNGLTIQKDFIIGYTSLYNVDYNQNRTLHYEYSIYEGSATSIAEHRDGKNLSNWNSFSNINEWKNTSGLITFNSGENPCTGENPGDLPSHFTLDLPGEVTDTITLNIGNAEITIEGGKYKDVHWDSRTGLVSAIPKAGGDRSLISVSGNTIGYIPVRNLKSFTVQKGTQSFLRAHCGKWEEYDNNNTTWITPGSTTNVPIIKYHYWYY